MLNTKHSNANIVIGLYYDFHKDFLVSLLRQATYFYGSISKTMYTLKMKYDFFSFIGNRNKFKILNHFNNYISLSFISHNNY